jgi:hypothetical protein
MSKFTNGLWQAVGRGVFSGETFICHADFGTPETNQMDYDEALANAKLIAAAPAMLELLKALVNSGELNSSEFLGDVEELIKSIT